jgi:hypothetical protein
LHKYYFKLRLFKKIVYLNYSKILDFHLFYLQTFAHNVLIYFHKDWYSYIIYIYVCADNILIYFVISPKYAFKYLFLTLIYSLNTHAKTRQLLHLSTYILLSNFMKINQLKNTVHNYDNSKFINRYYSKILNYKHFITGVYITINDSYR